MNSANTRNRKSIKTDKLVQSVKQEIIDGKYKSGDLLPTREQLVIQYETSRVTLQKSFDRLINEKFIVTQGNNGTYVAEELPFKYQIGILIPDKFKNILFYSSIISSIQQIESDTLYKFKVYHLFDYKEQVETKQLKKDIKNHLLAGIILIHIDPPEYEELEISDDDTFPILALSLDDDKYRTKMHPNINYISFDYKELTNHAITSLSEKNLKNVAWIVHEFFSEENHEYLIEQCHKNNIHTEPHWIHGIVLEEHSYRWIPNIIKLLTDSAKLDAIVVLNENILEAVISGLHKCNIRIPEDIQVISHVSFPHAFKNYIDIYKIGFDIYAFLLQGIQIINDMQKKTEYKEYIINNIKTENKIR